MSFRQVEDYGTEYVKKVVKIGRAISPKILTIEDLEARKAQFTEEEYFALHQQFKEWDSFQLATLREKSILAPLVEVFFDKNNVPVLVYPKFTPIMSVEEAELINEEDSIARLLYEFSLKGADDGELERFYRAGCDFCEVCYLSEEDCLYNLSNIGYHKTFGFRIIDFGLSKEFVEKD